MKTYIDYLLKIHNEVIFDKEKHTYLYKDKNYESVSNTLGWYKKWLKHIPKSHLKNATHKGIIIHKIFENWINDVIDNDYNDIESMFREYHKYLKNNIENNILYQNTWNFDMKVGWNFVVGLISRGYQPIKTELILINTSLKLAGTIDNLWVRETKEKIIFLISDWKTGDIRANHYAQIGIYEYMLKKSLEKVKNIYKKEIMIKTKIVSLKTGEGS